MRSSFFKRISLSLILIALGLTTLSAQPDQDSIALVDGDWKITTLEPGLIYSTLWVEVFGSKQRICCLSIDPMHYNVAPYQETKRATTEKLGKHSHAIAAVNGGFFNMKTSLAMANDFIKIDGETLPLAQGGWGNAAVGFGEDGSLVYHPISEEQTWQTQFSNIMTAGPQLLQNYVLLFDKHNADMRHPRTLIGNRSDGTIVLMTVDGRQNSAEGMSLGELAFLSYVLKMENALNLDGGGSTAMWHQGSGYLNQPSDKALGIFTKARKVANAIVVTRR